MDDSLKPKRESERTIGAVPYMFMWIGDGVNLGNMTLGASLIVAGAATLNVLQTFVVAMIAIAIISVIFALNDRFGYRTGIPYVVQSRHVVWHQGVHHLLIFTRRARYCLVRFPKLGRRNSTERNC